MTEELKILAEVAKTAWEYKDELIGGARELWSHLSGSKDKHANRDRPAEKKQRPSGQNEKHTKRALVGNQRSGVSDKRHTTEGMAESFQELNPSAWHTTPITDSLNGTGVRCVGRQPFCACVPGDISTWAAKGIFSQEDPLPIGSMTYQAINPKLMGLRLAAFASLYEKYAFRHLRLVYQPYVAATQAGGFGISWIDDAGQLVYVGPQEVTYYELQGIVPTTTSTFRQPAAVEVNYGGSVLFNTAVFVEDPTTQGFDVAEIRQSCQGAFLGAPMSSVDDTIDIYMGNFYFEFVCDFFSPYTPLNSAPAAITRDEQDAATEAILRVRGDPLSSLNKLQSIFKLPPLTVVPHKRLLNQPHPTKFITGAGPSPPPPSATAKATLSRR